MGGGIFLRSAYIDINYSLLHNNSADQWGGGIYLSDGAAGYLTHVTMSKDSSGIRVWNYSHINIISSIIWNETYSISENSTGFISHSDIQGGWWGGNGSDNIDTNPLFCDAENGDFTLSENSPCFGTGQDGANMGAFGVGCEGCILGDLNGDGSWNVLDIVTLANCVLTENCSDIEYGCAGDMNGDGVYNVLDIVILVNCTLADSCDEI